MKNNNQELNQLTKDSLKTALMQLLAENSVEEIKVTSLTKRAGVSRMAYYRNYPSITALYHELYDDYFRQFFQSNLKYLIDNQQQTFWVALFEFIFEHQKAAKILLSTKENPHFLDYLNQVFCNPIEHITDRYLIRGVVGNVFNVLTEWVQNEFDLTPAEIAPLCVNLTENIKIESQPFTTIQKYGE